jgi:hypothetical protein
MSYNPSLTFNEDICNTFTTEDSRTLNQFSYGFRFIGISPPESRRCLSEASLSRISIILVSKYS